MAQTHISGGEHVQRRSEITARDLVIEALEKFPDHRDKQFKWFQEQLAAEKSYQHDIDWYYFSNISSYILNTRNAARNPAPDPKTVRAAQVAFMEKVKEQVKLLALIMPNGKPMSACLGREMAEFGVAYQRLAKKVGAVRTVGEVLSEVQVRAFLK